MITRYPSTIQCRYLVVNTCWLKLQLTYILYGLEEPGAQVRLVVVVDGDVHVVELPLEHVLARGGHVQKARDAQLAQNGRLARVLGVAQVQTRRNLHRAALKHTDSKGYMSSMLPRGPFTRTVRVTCRPCYQEGPSRGQEGLHVVHATKRALHANRSAWLHGVQLITVSQSWTSNLKYKLIILERIFAHCHYVTFTHCRIAYLAAVDGYTGTMPLWLKRLSSVVIDLRVVTAQRAFWCIALYFS